VTGAYGPEKVQRVADSQPDSEEEEAKEFVEKLSQWRKGDVSNKKKKVRYVYKSVDDVLEQGKTSGTIRKEYRYEYGKILLKYIYIYIYSDTSANEDNSFQNHIR
jgi:hypothetical protein